MLHGRMDGKKNLADPEITGDPAGRRILGNTRAAPRVEQASLARRGNGSWWHAQTGKAFSKTARCPARLRSIPPPRRPGSALLAPPCFPPQIIQHEIGSISASPSLAPACSPRVYAREGLSAGANRIRTAVPISGSNRTGCDNCSQQSGVDPEELMESCERRRRAESVARQCYRSRAAIPTCSATNPAASGSIPPGRK